MNFLSVVCFLYSEVCQKCSCLLCWNPVLRHEGKSTDRFGSLKWGYPSRCMFASNGLTCQNGLMTYWRQKGLMLITMELFMYLLQLCVDVCEVFGHCILCFLLRVQALTITPWSEWWWLAVRRTCWTSELSSGGCSLALCIRWSRYTHNIFTAIDTLILFAFSPKLCLSLFVAGRHQRWLP